MTKICVSLMVERPDGVLDSMRKVVDWGGDLLEWRLDITREPEVESTLRQAPLPVIATARPREHGGRFHGGKGEQLELLLRAVKAGSSYVDWEYSRAEPLPPELQRIRDRVIVSYHDFNGTPPDTYLDSLIHEMAATGAGVAKIVTQASRVEDNLSVLNLIDKGRRLGVKVVAFCMGSLGRISRVACPLVGGAFTYVALEAEARAAPGQLTLAEMRKILELLR
jgi:3-dehydroquinate dehydratase type I